MAQSYDAMADRPNGCQDPPRAISGYEYLLVAERKAKIEVWIGSPAMRLRIEADAVAEAFVRGPSKHQLTIYDRTWTSLSLPSISSALTATSMKNMLAQQHTH